MFRLNRLSSSVDRFMYKALEVEFIISKCNCENKMTQSVKFVRIRRLVLDLHGVIVDAKRVVLFDYE